MYTNQVAKTKSILLTITLILSILISAGNLDFSSAQNTTSGNGTTISGTISTDTTRTLANGPLTLEGTVVISKGVTLTIEPGVTIDMNDAALQVEGTLVAISTADQKITFNGGGSIVFSDTSVDWNQQTQSGCIIAYSNLGYTQLTISGSSPMIYGNTVRGAQGKGLIYIKDGSPQILNNNLTAGHESPTTISVNGGEPVISGNQITGSRDNGLLGLVAPDWDTTHMARFGASYGIVVGNGNPYLSDNTIANCAQAIRITSGTVTVERTLFDTNVFGAIEIETSEKLIIQHNTFTNQSGGISGATSAASIAFNNFENTYNLDVATTTTENINATYNWWGTTDQAQISAKTSGENIHFVPFLTEPDHQATPVPISVALPSPTYQTVGTPSLSVYCRNAPAHSSFNLEIGGTLTAAGAGIPDAPILISYSFNAGESWNELTLVNTDQNGNFTAGWAPSATGNFLIEANWAGDATYSATIATVNFAVTPFQGQTTFSVATNSTLSALVFDSEQKTLSFNVSGPPETMGYANIYVPNTLLNDAADITIYLDGSPVAFSSTVEDDNWLLTLTYTHSSHAVTVDFANNTPDVSSTPSATLPVSPSQNPTPETAADLLGAVLVVVAVLVGVIVVMAVGIGALLRRQKK